MPGHHSTAQASVVVDDLASILLNTSQDAFSGNGLDPARNHTITITFIYIFASKAHLFSLCSLHFLCSIYDLCSLSPSAH